jgi:hypothetical protein
MDHFETTTTFPHSPRELAAMAPLNHEDVGHASLVGSFTLNPLDDANLNVARNQPRPLRKHAAALQPRAPRESWFHSVRGADRGLVSGKAVGRAEAGEVRQRDERGITEYMHVLARQHPDWFARLDAIDPDLASREDLEQMIETAPTVFLAGYLYGKLTMRVQLDAITRRDE